MDKRKIINSVIDEIKDQFCLPTILFSSGDNLTNNISTANSRF